MNKIEQLCAALGVSRARLARRLGYHPSTFYHLEAGRSKTPSERLIGELCETFCVSRVWLETGEGPILIGPQPVAEPENTDQAMPAGPLSAEEFELVDIYRRLKARGRGGDLLDIARYWLTMPPRVATMEKR